MRSNIEQKIKEKIDSVGVPLKDWNVSINYGIKTGFNDAFIITGNQREQIISEDPKSAEIIRPILRGRDIKRYCYHFADLYVILAAFGSYKYLEKQYPAVYKHVCQYEEKLRNRGQGRYRSNGKPNPNGEYPGQHHWLELDNNPRQEYLDDFNKQKIVYREISNYMDACIVEPGVFLNNKCYMITGDHLIYLISVMNSTLFNKVILQNANTTGGKGFGFLEKVCIPFPPETVEKQIIELYYSRTPSNSRTVDKKVDSIVYSLYGLADSEIRIVEAM